MRELQLEFDIDDASVISDLKSSAPRPYSGRSYASAASGVSTTSKPPPPTALKSPSASASVTFSAATTNTEMDAFFGTLQKRTDALQQANDTTSNKVNELEHTMRQTQTAVTALTTALEKQAETLSTITRQLEHMQQTSTSPPDSPLRKRQATAANNLSTDADENQAALLSQMNFASNVEPDTYFYPFCHPTAKFDMGDNRPMQICMKMTTRDTSWKWHCRKFVKEDLFRKVKFWDTVNYSAFSYEPNSVSGMFMDRFTFDSGIEPQKWWRASVRPFLISMLANCRNNVVKSIRNKHIGVAPGCM